MHTNKSDGRLGPQEVIDRYYHPGYDFLMLSDHDYLTSQQELARYHIDNTILIPGNEISGNGPHLLHVNAGNAYASDCWDIVLADRRRILGFAGDDTHEREDIGREWIVVYTQDDSVGGIVQSLKTGSFYASSGVIINTIEVVQNNTKIKIETKNYRKIVAIADYGFRLTEVKGRTIHFELEATLPNADRFKGFCHPDGQAGYIRFECWGEAEQFAWTQPFFIREV